MEKDIETNVEDFAVKHMRYGYIDILKGIGVVLMVLGHMHFCDDIFNKYIFGFHMPLFFIISGFLYHKPDSIHDALTKKVKTLLVPYLFFGIIYYGLWILIDYDSEGYIWSPVVALFVRMTEGLPIESALWFLPVLFFTFVMYIMLERYIVEFKYRVTAIILITLLGCGITNVLYNFVFGGIGTAMSALAFFLIGNIISQNKEKVKKYDWLINNLLIFILGVVLNTLLIFLNGKLNMRTGEWAIIPLSYFNAVVGCGIYCKVAIWIDKSKLWRACLQYIGRNSIVFLCTNHLAIRISSKLLGLFFDSDGIINGILYWSLVFVIAMLGMCSVVEIMNRTRLCMFIGKNMKRNV